MITYVRLREVLRYSKRTGVFVWRVQVGQRGTVGAVAGCLRRDGYLDIQIDRKKYLLHRLAWLYVKGRWPKKLIDHKNQERADNRFANLREADQSFNLQNQQRARCDNRTGLLGATHNHGSFKAVIGLRGVRTHIGNFKTAEAAHQAYVTAKRKIHPANQL